MLLSKNTTLPSRYKSTHRRRKVPPSTSRDDEKLDEWRRSLLRPLLVSSSLVVVPCNRIYQATFCFCFSLTASSLLPSSSSCLHHEMRFTVHLFPAKSVDIFYFFLFSFLFVISISFVECQFECIIIRISDKYSKETSWTENTKKRT